jgi:acyl-homoserine lactone acylase PvdQ
MKRFMVGACCAISAIAILPAAASAQFRTDFAGQAFQVLAPGADGNLPLTRNSTDQAALYDALTPLRGNVTAADLKTKFLSEKFGPSGKIVKTESTGRKGLKIVRTADGIPHITGKTRCDVTFGMGYVAAKDRGILLGLGLGPAFAATLDIPGINAFGLVTSGRKFTPSAAAVKFVADQAKLMTKYGKEGKEVLADLKCWADGVNAFNLRERAPADRMPRVGLTEAIAAYAFIGSIFGNGGGGGVDSSIFLNQLQTKFGVAAGTKIYRELSQTNEAEAATSIPKAFPYNLVPTGPTPGSPLVDHGSKGPAAAATLAATASSHRIASNALLVGPKKSASGNSLAVMGPQLGYFYPEIVMQVDIHGGGLDFAGAAPPTMPYGLLGRAKDYAWSLTSASNDNTDVFLEQLCEPGGGTATRASTHYNYKGKCVAMKRFDAGLLGASATEPARQLVFNESVHGPIGGTVTVGGQPYAISTMRATRGREPVSALFFKHMNENKVTSPSSFFKIANELETTFNIHYSESKHIAFFSSGRLPVRAKGTDPSLATLGTGAYDWKGFLTEKQHPHQADPPSGYILNWNNKPAPMWGAADGTYGWGSAQRVELFTGFPAKSKLENVAGVMNGAATRDLRGSINWPVIKRVLAKTDAPSPLAAAAAAQVDEWVANGADRLDTTGNGEITAPGAAIMDKAFPGIARAVMEGKLGTDMTDALRSQMNYSNNPSSGGSSFGSGWYSYIDKDLRQILGDNVKAPWTYQYCGDGTVNSCSQALWAAVKAAADGLAADTGRVDPATWHSSATRERITFAPGLLTGTTMRWTNRPTFQQAIEFNGHR